MTYEQIPDYDYIGSAIGNAYFSGLTFPQLWECISISKTREELDCSIETAIILNNIVKEARFE